MTDRSKIVRWRITEPDGRVLSVYAPSREAAEQLVAPALRDGLLTGVDGVTIEQVDLADEEVVLRQDDRKAPGA